MNWLPMALSVLALQGSWTWTLYEGDGPLVLAHEVPDTPQLKAVMECEPGSGVARVDLYEAGATAGVATMSSGDATAQTESVIVSDHSRIAIRSDHPVFGQFVLTGDLSVAMAGEAQVVVVQPAHLAKLRRFAELCGG